MSHNSNARKSSSSDGFVPPYKGIIKNYHLSYAEIILPLSGALLDWVMLWGGFRPGELVLGVCLSCRECKDIRDSEDGEG